MSNAPAPPKILLVCTVGGSPDPLVACLKHWNPSRAWFVTTAPTTTNVEKNIIPGAAQLGRELDPGQYDILELTNGQDLSGILTALRALETEVDKWLARGENYRVVVDYTGGTKAMSVALALIARRWRCVYSYIGGSERTKEGVGVVVSGSEQIFNTVNPWDALGYQAVEQFTTLFDQRCFQAAAGIAVNARSKQSDPSRAPEFSALNLLAEACDYWDRFQHKEAANKFNDLKKAHNHLRSLFPARAQVIIAAIESATQHLQAINRDQPDRHHLLDLLANAQRRQDEGRFDDAVARLYRCIELIAQIALAKNHRIPKTDCVPLEQIPEPLRGDWGRKANNGILKLGLQDDFRLLEALNDPIASRFNKLPVGDPKKNPLTARNQSILAHGLQPVGPVVCGQLFETALQLADIHVNQLPSFPRLSS